MKKHLKPQTILIGLPALAILLFTGATALSLKPVTKSFAGITADSRNASLTDRNGIPLSITYQTAWNTRDTRPLYEMPELLKDSFIHSEDRKFFDHHGVDWQGRTAALWQNIRHRRTVRGASTITEQVVRMINPRPRTLWSKWLEGIEATLLERHANKAAILEFYLNQIPYASNRRGVTQAARYYFNRDLETLTPKETLALVILARAPSAYDLYRNAGKLDAPLQRLAAQLREENILSAALYSDLQSETLDTLKPSLPVDARHFARFVSLQNQNAVNRTTLDASLQSQIQNIIDTRLKKLSSKNVRNAGAIVIDNKTGNIVAWVVGGANDPDTEGGDIDTILTPRQPGSALKPFLYAMALEKGWTAATIINDAPISEAVGSGLHRFRNYSNTHYGPLTLREALGNSLNIPAILTIHYVGTDRFLTRLHRLGFDSLTRGSQIYDEGLALGNGEVTLYELTRAYAALANRGEYRDLSATPENISYTSPQQIFSPEVSSLIGNILSDPYARSLEFGRNSLLNMPVRTAAKTGTSTDYRDAWTVAYNAHYTVGIWMGNLDRTPMNEVTGSTGPALAARSIFNILNRTRDPEGLYLSPALIEQETCTRPVQDGNPCPTRTELFVAGTENPGTPVTSKIRTPELVRPTDGLMMAHDPRIPASHQKFRFELAGLQDGDKAEWILDGKNLGITDAPHYLWPLEQGNHELSVIVHRGPDKQLELPKAAFIVK